MKLEDGEESHPILHITRNDILKTLQLAVTVKICLHLFLGSQDTAPWVYKASGPNGTYIYCGVAVDILKTLAEFLNFE